MDTPSSKRIKVVTVKHEEDMKKPLNNEDLTRTMLSGPEMYSEDPHAIDWEKKGVPGNATTFDPTPNANAMLRRSSMKYRPLKNQYRNLKVFVKLNFNYFI